MSQQCRSQTVYESLHLWYYRAMCTHQTNASVSHTRPSLHIRALHQHHKSTFTVMAKQKTENFFLVCSLKKTLTSFKQISQ